MNTFNNQKLQKYILVDTDQKPSYSRIKSCSLTNYEASVKNIAFKMNRVNKKYILEKDWK